jgi:UrcA family protein
MYTRIGPCTLKCAVCVVGLNVGAACLAAEDSRATTGQPGGDYASNAAAVAPEISLEPEEPLLDPSLFDTAENPRISIDDPGISIDPGEIITVRSVGPSAVVLETLSRPVSYADLDLILHADVLELQNRVRRMAKAICDRLHDTHPFTSPQGDACVQQAVKDALTQVQSAVAEAVNGVRPD